MTRCQSGLASLLLVAGIARPLFGQAEKPPQPALDPELPYQARRSNPVTYEVDFSVVVTAPEGTKLLRVWLPIPPSDQGQEVRDRELSTFPLKVTPQLATEPVYGNRFAYFEFVRPRGAQIIRHKFRVTVWELHWDVDPDKVVRITDWPKGFDKYLRGEPEAVVLDERVRKLLGEIVPAREGPARDMTAIMAWVHRTMTYDHTAASLRASTRHALDHKRGHCSDFHSVCAAFGRALNSPTRVVYGINPFPKNSPSHCKLEVYLPPYGWVSFDVSETHRLMAAIRADANLDGRRKERLLKAAAERLARGYRDNTWYLQTKGTDYELAPPARQRVPVVRTIYAEADGEPLPDPDPANPAQREFGWMTVHQYVPDRPVTYPFADWRSLEKE